MLLSNFETSFVRRFSVPGRNWSFKHAYLLASIVPWNTSFFIPIIGAQFEICAKNSSFPKEILILETFIFCSFWKGNMPTHVKQETNEPEGNVKELWQNCHPRNDMSVYRNVNTCFSMKSSCFCIFECCRCCCFLKWPLGAEVVVYENFNCDLRTCVVTTKQHRMQNRSARIRNAPKAVAMYTQAI